VRWGNAPASGPPRPLRRDEPRGTGFEKTKVRTRTGQLLAVLLAADEERRSRSLAPHELRHSGASLMLTQGTDLYVVSDVMGHASIAITKDVCGHLVEGHMRSAAEAMLRGS